MKILRYVPAAILFCVAGFNTCPGQSHSPLGKELKKYESTFNSFSKKIDVERMRNNLFYLSGQLPCRVLNYSIPGHDLSTLEEADQYIIDKLNEKGYKPEKDETRVRAFSRDMKKQPVSQQYAPPDTNSPWYTAGNIIADIPGQKYPNDLIIIISHKDSQSWIESPGANDNAIGTCGNIELATILKGYRPDHTIRFIFCNEEHSPWTSITAAANIKASGKNVLALINLDAIGVKSPEMKGRLINVTRYTTPEGERLADLFIELNNKFKIGLEESKLKSGRPADDEGSFIKAGFPWAVKNAGSMPNADPNYHAEGDTPDRVDIKNAQETVRLTLAAVLYIDKFGRP
jgi:hypothetical protein